LKNSENASAYRYQISEAENPIWASWEACSKWHQGQPHNFSKIKYHCN